MYLCRILLLSGPLGRLLIGIRILLQEALSAFSCREAAQASAIDYRACRANPATVARLLACHAEIVFARAVVRTADAFGLRDPAITYVALREAIVCTGELSAGSKIAVDFTCVAPRSIQRTCRIHGCGGC